MAVFEPAQKRCRAFYDEVLALPSMFRLRPGCSVRGPSGWFCPNGGCSALPRVHYSPTRTAPEQVRADL